MAELVVIWGWGVIRAVDSTSQLVLLVAGQLAFRDDVTGFCLISVQFPSLSAQHQKQGSVHLIINIMGLVSVRYGMSVLSG